MTDAHPFGQERQHLGAPFVGQPIHLFAPFCLGFDLPTRRIIKLSGWGATTVRVSRNCTGADYFVGWCGRSARAQVQVDLLGRTLPPVNPHSHNTLTDGHGRASRGAPPKTQREGVEMAEDPKLVIQGDDGDGLRFDQWLADILTSCVRVRPP